jgi:hypothetical protein
MEEKEVLAHRLFCMACLGVGRKVQNITDEKQKRFYLDAVNEIQVSNCFITV